MPSDRIESCLCIKCRSFLIPQALGQPPPVPPRARRVTRGGSLVEMIIVPLTFNFELRIPHVTVAITFHRHDVQRWTSRRADLRRTSQEFHSERN